jgi:excisionase family DNA binding protein
MSSSNERLSIDGGAALLGVSRFTLRKWLRERRLPFHKVGRRIVLSRDDVERFLRSCRVESRPSSVA